jgi:hypothetical protein
LLKIKFNAAFMLSMMPVIARQNIDQFARQIFYFLREPQFFPRDAEISDTESGAAQ